MANYGTILILFLISAGLAGTFWALATVLGPKAMNPSKAQPFECGNPPLGEMPTRISVKYYIVALLFIVFDMETVFLFPWAVNFRDLGWLGFWSATTFVGILGLGLVYVWKKGALDWR